MSQTNDRVRVVEGDLNTAGIFAPIDAVVAVHVLYFWHDPLHQTQQLRDLPVEGGVLALGYQLRKHMPKPARKYFPRAGHRLYETDADVAEMLVRGINVTDVEILANPSRPSGRLLIAHRTISTG